MKLLRAKFENFRLLRDLEVEFSCDNEKKLTVIRAANESGKTTMLTALQWALYGDDALPAKGVNYRIHPIDWKDSDGDEAKISVSVDFELTETKRKLSSFTEEKKKYRIIRRVTEKIDSMDRRSTPTVKLVEISDSGYDEMKSPQSWIDANLPLDLREVFFTDGDRALNFIESTGKSNSNRKEVENAIKSLLQLGVIEDAITHVKKANSEISRQIQSQEDMKDLRDILSELSDVNEEISEMERGLENAIIQFDKLNKAKKQVDVEIAKALEKGNKNQLERELNSTKKAIIEYENQMNSLKIEHSSLFQMQLLADELIGPILAPSIQKLDDMRDQGKIPNMTIPVLEDRLFSQICICGESLSEVDSEGKNRREYIKKLIKESTKNDQIQELISVLYFSIIPHISGEKSANWCDIYEEVYKKRGTISNSLEESRRKLKDLETQIGALDDADIQSLMNQKSDYDSQRDKFLTKKIELETKIAELQTRQEELTKQRDKEVKEKEKEDRIGAQIDVTNDILGILKRTNEQLKNEEMQKVSELMNGIFLEMIGSDPEFDANIQKAEISDEYEIIVYGANDRTLNPDRDLNGASRRALTLAFILALTKISQVEAPNVIDTPLGMLSGFVKQSLLKVVARESSQLILFLTHSEIQGCEDIIDTIAGKVCTLTNSKHYPKMLENDPGVEDAKVLVCSCNHRSECNLCKRNDLDESNSEEGNRRE